MNFNVLLVLLLMLSANYFFDCTLLGEDLTQIYKLVLYVVFIIVALLTYIKSIPAKNKAIVLRLKGHKVIDKCIVILLFGLLISLFNSFLFKDQSLIVCLITNIPMTIAYLSYFVFKKMNLTNADERNIIILMAFVYCVAFIVSVVTIPNPLFGEFEFSEERGGFRLRIKGIFWVSLCFFFLIQKYKERGRYRYLFGALLVSLFVAASLARQYILWTTVLGLMFLMLNTKLRKKLLLMLIVVLVGFFVVPEIPLVKNLTELSEKQKEKNDNDHEDIRIKDYQTFLFDYDRNIIQYVFGCGLPSQGNSRYGAESEYMSGTLGIIPSDVGWAGTVFYYGYFSTFILLFLFLYSIFKIKGEYYKRFYLFYIALCAIGGGPILYSHEVIISMFVMSNISKRDLGPKKLICKHRL